MDQDNFKSLFKEANSHDEARTLLCGLAAAIQSSVLYGLEKADAYDSLVCAYRLRQREISTEVKK